MENPSFLVLSSFKVSWKRGNVNRHFVGIPDPGLFSAAGPGLWGKTADFDIQTIPVKN